MSQHVKRSSKGRYYSLGKRYSVETYAYIFKTIIEHKRMTGEYPLPSHLSEKVSVSFKVAKKAISFVSGESKSLYKPRGHGYTGNGSMKLSMIDQFFCSVSIMRNRVDLYIVMLPNNTNFQLQK